MITSNISLGINVDIDPTSDINNVKLGNNVKISKHSSVFGSPSHPVEVDNDTKISSACFVNGYDAPVKIGARCGISRQTHIMSGSAPWSEKLRKIFPVVKEPICIGDDCWIGADCIIAPGVTLGDFCIVAANSFVNKSFPAYSIIGGNPAKLIRMLTEEERKTILSDD